VHIAFASNFYVFLQCKTIYLLLSLTLPYVCIELVNISAMYIVKVLVVCCGSSLRFTGNVVVKFDALL